MRCNHLADRNDGQRSTGAKTRGGQTDSETTPVREPFHGVADAYGVDRAGTDTANPRADIQRPQALRLRVDDPGDGDQNTTGGDHQFRPKTRTKTVRNPTFDGRQPGLERDEDAERNLDVGQRPTMLITHGLDE